MASSLSLNGKAYTVSPEFAAHVKTALGTLSFHTDQVEAERLALLLASNDRVLKKDETERLAYLTHVKNVANAIRVVGDHHDPVKEWGLDGWDAVHGNKHAKDCGCVRHYVFDHHSAVDHFGHGRVSKERPHYEIEPLYLCPAHARG